jgi:hypothetical protein
MEQALIQITKRIYQVVIDSSGSGCDEPTTFTRVYWRKGNYPYQNSPFQIEFNAGPRIGFQPFQLPEEAIGNPLENKLFVEAEAQVGPCDLITL